MKKIAFLLSVIFGLAACSQEDQVPIYELKTAATGTNPITGVPTGYHAYCSGEGTTCTKQRKNQLENVNLFQQLVSALERAVQDDKIGEFMQSVEAQQLFPTFFAENRMMVDEIIALNPKCFLLNDNNMLVMLKNRKLPYAQDNVLYAIELL
jgi:hypothetical protein